MITGTLTGWSVSARSSMGLHILSGRIYGDKRGRFSDGEYIHTSYIVSVDFNKSLVTTNNSTYKLGEPTNPAEWGKIKEIMA